MLPPALVPVVNAALHEAGEETPVRSFESVKGGYTSTSLRIRTRRAVYLLKWSGHHSYVAEARGLEAIGRAGALRVPRVLAAADAAGELPGFLLQEWVATKPGWTRDMNRKLGAQLAALHRAGTSAPGFGSVRQLHAGGTAEPSGWLPDWPSCFRDHFLRPAIERAERAGALAPALAPGLDRLCARLADWLGGDEPPALIHGDLWRNNVLCDTRGEPVLIDPAAAYADRELELTYTALWGGFSPSFVQAYQEVWPSLPGLSDRRELYKLCLLLQRADRPNELGPVAATVRWFVGE